MDQEHIIDVDQLQIGVYVYLDVGWMHHPFSFNNFKIRNEDQLKTIRQLGLKQVRWDPARSDLKPLSRDEVARAAVAQAPAATVEESATNSALSTSTIIQAKQARIQVLTEHRENIAKVEAAFMNVANVVREINKTIYSQPEKTLANARQLIGDMVEDLLMAPDLAVQVMSEKSGREDVYFHSINVSILAMIIGRELKFPPEIIRIIGVGALMHDIGLNEIPAKILNNTETLTKSEREFREQHCQYGLDIGKKAGMAQSVLNIIYQHHEYFDGTGYPRRLKGDAIDPLARCVTLANVYDNLCNPTNVLQALTPHEALSQMFAQHRTRFDPKLLQVFIRFMGVYPPGTVVGLSNDTLGLVIKVNAMHPLKPMVIVYDADTPKNEAIILDLFTEPEINISRAIRPAQLPPNVYDYLSPRRRVSYYFDAGTPGGG